jgi:sec-independent protein translocase protein TatB
MTSAPPYRKKWYQFMLDIAWPELIVIGIVAVVAIGPKDLPKVMNTMGRWAGKARAMAQDVQRSLEQLNYETEIADKLKQDIVTPAQAATPVKPPRPHAPPHTSAAEKPGAAPETKEEPHDRLGNT